MTYIERDLFRIGKAVNEAMLSARVGTLRPTRPQMKAAASVLNITQSLAWKAWNVYTWLVG